jgi:F-type H+-transporting ATPase subunit epsilon
MAATTLFELVSPERLFFSQPVEMVVVPGTEGDFAAMPGRMPAIATVRPGVIVIFEDGKPKERIFVAGGFAEMNEESCTVLAEEAELVSDLSLQEAESRLAGATEAYGNILTASESEKAAIETELAVATARVAAANGETGYH